MADELELKASDAFVLETRIVENMSAIRQHWALLAADLYTFRMTSAFEHLGYETLGQWLASPHIEIQRSMFFRLIQTYELLVINRGVEPEQLAQVDVAKMQEVLPAIRRKQVEVDVAISDVKSLPLRDLRERYRGMNVLAQVFVEPPVEPDEFHYEKCPMCGTSVRVTDDVG